MGPTLKPMLPEENKIIHVNHLVALCILAYPVRNACVEIHLAHEYHVVDVVNSIEVYVPIYPETVLNLRPAWLSAVKVRQNRGRPAWQSRSSIKIDRVRHAGPVR